MADTSGPKSITGLGCGIASARWLDDHKEVPFLQDDSGQLITLDCHGYDYGTNFVVRVAELTLET